MSHIRELAEQQFKAASAEAALFELRLRLLAGYTHVSAAMPINANLSVVCDQILTSYALSLTDNETQHLKRACQIRNKLLHCEFSSNRKKLNDINPKVRDGGISCVEIDTKSPSTISSHVRAAIAGASPNQKRVSSTNTRTLQDVFGWLLESQSGGDFDESIQVFAEAMQIVLRLTQDIASPIPSRKD